MLPGTIVYVFVGTTIGSITDAASGNYSAGPAGLTLLIVGSILACVAIVYISIVVKRYLNNAAALESERNTTTDANPDSNANRESTNIEETVPFIVNRHMSDNA